ncbi:MAG: hypothetical protein QM488_17095 [Rhizobiaceae bacterium]
MLKIHKVFVQILLVLFLTTTVPTWGLSQERWGTPFDDVIEKKQLKIIIEKNENGLETREFVLPGNILVRENRKNEKIIGSFLLDQSGFGSILCTQSILLSTKIWLDVCDDFNNSKSSERLNIAIGRIFKFIVENSILPVSINELNIQLDIKAVKLRTYILETQQNSGDTKNIALLQCRGAHDEAIEFVEQISNRIAEQSEKEFEQSIDELLSVPRLPVMNPCL